jgi:hypothetical protein
MNQRYATKTETMDIVDQFPSLLKAHDQVKILRRDMPFDSINQIEIKNNKKVVKNENSNFCCEIKTHE